MVTENEFKIFLEKEIKPKLDEIYTDRDKIINLGLRNKISFSLLIAMSLVYVFFYIYTHTGSLSVSNYALILTSGYIFVLYVFSKPHKYVFAGRKAKLNSKFKSEVISKTIHLLNPTLIYKPIYRSRKKQIQDCNLVSKFTEFSEDDGIFGELNNKKIKISEAHIYNHFTTKFSGLLILIKYPDNIDESTFEYFRSKLQRKINTDIEIKVVNDALTIGIHHKEQLFEFNYSKKKNKQVISNLFLIFHVINGLDQLTNDTVS